MNPFAKERQKQKVQGHPLTAAPFHHVGKLFTHTHKEKDRLTRS